jgi:PAS domain S-box-containing protein
MARVEAGVAEIDGAGRIVAGDERFVAIAGRDSGVLAEMVHPEDLGELLWAVEDAAGPSVVEMRCVRPDGATVWVQGNVFRRDGRATLVLVDITARMRAAEALGESEERFRTMADASPMMVWVTEADERCTFLSKSWYELTGQTPETGLGAGWLDAIHPADRVHVARVFRAKTRRREEFQHEYRLRRADGSYRWALESAAPRVGPTGELEGYIGSVIDITERKEGEVRLRASRSLADRLQQLTALLANAPTARDVAALAAKRGGQILEAAACAVYELTEEGGPAELLAARAIGGEYDRAELLALDTPAPLATALSTGKAQWLEDRQAMLAAYPGLEACNVHRGVQAVVALPLLSSGRVAGGIEYTFRAPTPFSDLQREFHLALANQVAQALERARLRAEREKHLAELERTVHFSQLFMGVLGHDLRNPLAAITTSADALLRHGHNERNARQIARMRHSAERMARMIDQILDFTRARIGGGIVVATASVDVEALATHLIEELDGIAPLPIVLEVRGDPHGEWDGDRLGQVISNLLKNAIEHGGADEPVRMTIDGTFPTDLHITVSNAGVIPESVLSTLFEPFRGNAARGKVASRGLGLGLYIVQQIVEAHGGNIEMLSSAEEGTRVVISLPRHSPQGPRAARA